MKLHRMELTNYRGVSDRKIDFPERGVVVICGPNEIGKTSMIEALDLLLKYRSSSRHRDVIGVQPAHADVGTEVAAEISSGKYRFVYRKRFNKDTKTELSIAAPAKEQLKGDEAHERVEAMLKETMDLDLWKAQRVLQSESTAAVALNVCNALARALDVAAGETASSSGAETVLIEDIEAEFLTYFTATGKRNKDYKAIEVALTSAEADVNHCREALDAVEDMVAQHGECTERRNELSGQRRAAATRRVTAQKAADDLAGLTAQLKTAEITADAARKSEAAAVLLRDERRQLLDGSATRQQTIAMLAEQVAAATETHAASVALADAAIAAKRDAEAEFDRAQGRVAKARGVIDAVAAASKLAEIDETQAALTRISCELSQIAITEELMMQVTDAAAAVQRYEDQLRLSAGTVEFTAVADLELITDGQPVTLAAGESWRPTASAATTVELPGLLSVRIDPGVTTAEVNETLLVWQGVLGEKLAQARVTDVAEARDVSERRRALVSAEREMAARLSGLCGGEDATELRFRLEVLAAEMSGSEGVDAESAQTEFTAAGEALQRARERADTARSYADEVTAAVGGKATAAEVLRSNMHRETAELETLQNKLAALRSDVDDDQVAAAAAAASEARRLAEAAYAALAEEHAARNPAAIETELLAAVTDDDALTTQLGDIDRKLSEITGALEMAGSEGRRGQLDEALIAERHARRSHQRWCDRANAAELLLTVMKRHQSETNQRYAEPFRLELERLGKPVFGPTFEVAVDEDLRIINRSRDGSVVDFESLSGGAKEQLGILVRLTGAALVAADDTVPVVIDDALGFSDPERLDAMCKVLGDCGREGQVIVLTCQRDRYAAIADAQFIELTA